MNKMSKVRGQFVGVEFWKFFEKIQEKLFDEPSNSELASKINSEVALLGELDWELGPYGTNQMYFCLSPNMQNELLHYTRNLIALAPVLKNWHFFPAKPKKIEKVASFQLINDDGSITIVNTDLWQIVLFQYDDNVFDIDLLVDVTTYKSENRDMITDIAITNAIGEMAYIEQINKVSVVSNFDYTATIEFRYLAEVIAANI
jgi:hypothetical protein